MASALPLLAVTLLLGAPVQKPSVTPVQPEAGEAAIAPAHVDTEAAAAEPAGQPIGAEPEPEPEVQPEPEPEPAPAEPAPGELPSWQADPVTPPTGGPPPIGGDPSDLPLVDEWGMPIAPPPPPKGPPRGVGLFAAAGGLFAIMITRQWVTSLFCEDLHCGFRGNADRVMSLGVMGLAAGGGWLEGRHIEWKRGQADLPQKSVKGRRIAGWTLFAAGLGGLVTDTVLYNLCYEQALGPYTHIEGFSYTCAPDISAVVIDFSTLFGAVGIGLGMSAERQLRERARTELSLAPWGGRGQAGLTLTGRF